MRMDDDENDERRHLPEDISLQLLHNYAHYIFQGCVLINVSFIVVNIVFRWERPKILDFGTR